jgi:hypothetical protein
LELNYPAWGQRHLGLTFPFAKILLTGLSDTQSARITHHYGKFICSDALMDNPDLPVFGFNVCRLSTLPPYSIEEMSRDNLYTPIRQRCGNRISIAGVRFETSFDVSEGQTENYIGVFNEEDLALDIVFENILRIHAAYTAPMSGGVVLHSAGLVFDGEAYIFVGRSGAGKTTLTRKAHRHGATVLSDDINLLLPRDDHFVAHAVPFSGEFGRTLQQPGSDKNYPVKAICLLTQGETLSATQTKKSLAMARLVVGCPYVNTDGDEYDRLSNVLENLTTKYSVINLSTRKDNSIDQILQSIAGVEK